MANVLTPEQIFEAGKKIKVVLDENAEEQIKTIQKVKESFVGTGQEIVISYIDDILTNVKVITGDFEAMKDLVSKVMDEANHTSVITTGRELA